MRRTTRNNIFRYMVVTAFVSAFVLIGSLMCMGLHWLINKTGWPIYQIVLVTCFIFVIYIVGRVITIKDKKKE